MKKPSHKQLESIARLSGDTDFSIFFGWLSESFLEEAVQSTKIDKEPQRTWAQGRVQQVEQIIETIKQARSKIDAIVNSQNGQGE